MPLVDQFGREIKASETSKPDTRSIGSTTIYDRMSDYPSQGLTPASLASLLADADKGDMKAQAELYEEMEEKDAHTASVFQTRKNSVSGLPWEIVPASEDAADKRIAEDTEAMLRAIPDFNTTILEMLDAIGRGFSLHDIDWMPGGIGINSFKWIHQKKALFYDYGGVQDQWQAVTEVPKIITKDNPYEGEEWPPFRLLMHTYKSRAGFITRAGMLRPIVWLYLFKNYSLKDWVQFAEVYGMPLRLGKYKSDATEDAKAALKTALQQLGSDAAGIINEDTMIEFIESSQNKGTESVYKSLIEFSNREISKVVLGQTLTTEAGEQGSYALGRVQDLVRHDLIEADALALETTIDDQVVYPYVGFTKGFDQAKALPHFRFLFDPPEDTKAIAETIKIAKDLGQPVSQEFISERLRIPLPKDGETVVTPPQRAPAPFAGSVMLQRSQLTPTQKNLDSLIEDGVLKGIAASDIILQEIKAIISSGSGYPEIKKKLAAAFPALSKAKLGEVVQNTNYYANLYGRSDVVAE